MYYVSVRNMSGLFAIRSKSPVDNKIQMVLEQDNKRFVLTRSHGDFKKHKPTEQSNGLY